MASLSNSSIDRLGDSIRVDSTSGYQEILLNGLRVEWARAASEVAGRIQSNPLLGQFDVSWREKHLGTIRAKLKRQETARLSQIRDVAGCRVVIAAGRQSQKAVVDELQREFGSSVRKTINYLEKSQLGYRAIHLELLHNGVLVEIQVRTQLQHAWAESMERLGDIAGRDVRYVKNFGFEHLAQLGRTLAVGLSQSLSELSELIAGYEREEEKISLTDSRNLLAHQRQKIIELINDLKPRFDQLQAVLP